MKLCVLSIRDGRDEVHARSLESLQEAVPEPAHHIVVDDASHELGFSGAIQHGWEQVLETDATHLLHHEADFLFRETVPVQHMVNLLDRKPYLTQVALKRGPVNAEEKAAGGIVELAPDDFHQRFEAGLVWTEHRRFGFTTNPCIYPVALCAQGWPQVSESEGTFGLWLLEDPDAHSCFWGGKYDGPRVEHIGVREGVGY